MTAPDFIYKFFLDGTEFNNPSGWEDMTYSIRRDKDIKGVFITMDGNFTFEGSAYDYLDGLKNSNYCATVDLIITESRDHGLNFFPFYTGIIKISDVEFFRKFRQAKTKVFDNSFFAKIYDNKNLEVKPTSTLSKNGETIDAPLIRNVQMFEPQTGNYYTIQTGTGKERSNSAYKAYDLFWHLIRNMSDGDVEFDSVVFGGGGEYENIFVTFGKVIRRTQAGYSLTDYNTDIPTLSFQKLFQALDRRLNLGMFIDNSGAIPKIRIEKWDDLFKTTSVVQIPNIDSIKEKISTDDIYSQLKIGSNATDDSAALQFPENIDWVGFKAETYTIVGKCNVDRALDLTDDFVVSSNVIEQILVNNTADETYDEDWFIIKADFISGNLWQATRSNWLAATPPYYYNEFFINSNISTRFLNAVPNNIALVLGNQDNTFLASSTSDKTLDFINAACSIFYPFCPVPFEDDSTLPNHDTNNNYNTSTYEYTVPASGLYTFQVKIFLSAPTNTTPEIKLGSHITIKDGSGNVLRVAPLDQFASVRNIMLFKGGVWDMTVNNVILNAAETASLTIYLAVSGGNINPASVIIKQNSTFAITKTVTGQGNFTTYDPADYPIIKDEFEIEFDSWKFDLILQNPLMLIEFGELDINLTKGWIDEIKYKPVKQEGTFRLLSSKNSR